MAAKLAALSFDIVAAIDQDLRSMRDALRRFDRALQGAEMGLFFYAGHAMDNRLKNDLFASSAVLEPQLFYELT